MNKIFRSLYYRLKKRVERHIAISKLGIENDSNYQQMLLDQLYILRIELSGIEVLIDVGANEGMFSKALSRIFKGMIIFCIEPNNKLNGAIKKNLNGENLLILNELISSKKMKIPFNIHQDSQMSSILETERSKLEKNFRWDDPNKIERVEMNTTTLDELVKKNSIDLSKTTLLKIDTQGNELDVLKGSKNSLKQIDFIIVEYMFDSPYICETTCNSVFQFLFDSGFYFSGPTMSANRLDGKIGAINFLFKKKLSQ